MTMLRAIIALAILSFPAAAGQDDVVSVAVYDSHGRPVVVYTDNSFVAPLPNPFFAHEDKFTFAVKSRGAYTISVRHAGR